MNEFLKGQAQIVERARMVEYPRNVLIKPLNVPLIFSIEPRELSFHMLDLGMNDLKSLAQEVNFKEELVYSQALIIKKAGKPMVALGVGVDASSKERQQVAAIFNLTLPKSLDVILTGGWRRDELRNDNKLTGGLDLSRLLSDNPKNEAVEITTDRMGLYVRVEPGIKAVNGNKI